MEKTYTIQQHSKRFKQKQIYFLATFLVGVFLLVISGFEIITIPLLMILTGTIGQIVIKIQLWWHHG